MKTILCFKPPYFKPLSLILLGLMLSFFISGCNEDRYIHVGPNWEAIHTLEPSDKHFNVELKAKQHLVSKDCLSFKIKSEKSGKLWLVQVGPDDTITLLFPNELSKENKIQANQWMSVPAGHEDYEIQAEAPFGKSTIAAIVTTNNLGLEDVLSVKNDMKKALVLIDTAPQWGIAHNVIDVKEK